MNQMNHVRKTGARKSTQTPVILCTMMGKMPTFDQLLSCCVNHGLFTGSNSDITTVKLSDSENISLSVDTFGLDEGKES